MGLVGFINHLNNQFSVQVPARGGSIHEGILGTPRFINPVLANSDVDQDLSALVYSGLVRRVPTTDGTSSMIIPDLAESYTISDDGKIYTFVLKKNAEFQDHKSVTANDVVFTIKTIEDTQFQSPLAENWIGVTVEAVDASTVKITLPRPFSGFLDTASVGILPQHIWGTFTTDEFLASKYNTLPVGSGPYKIKRVSRDRVGIADKYTLSSFKRFALGNPFVSKIVISLYPNEQDLVTAYERGDINLLGNVRPYEISADNTKYTVTSPLPRMFGLFLNTNKNTLLADSALQSVINSAIDPSEITNSVFQGYAQSISHPLPELAQPSPTAKPAVDTLNQKLESMGWKLNTETGIREKNKKQLSFSISTADTPELKYTAQIIQKQLKAVGIATDIQIFQLNDLENSVIKKRSFDALLFGQLIRNDADLYAFWHSSQKTADGLNIIGYTNTKLDALIEKLFATTDSAQRGSLLQNAEQELKNAPVIWLYQPDFIYAMRHPIYGMDLTNIISKHDRFATVYTWYTQTDTVWKIFRK